MSVIRLSSVFKLLLIYASVVSSAEVTNAPKKPHPYALSPTYLQYLSSQERKLYHVMKNYEKELEYRLTLVKRYNKDYETSSIDSTTQLSSDTEKDLYIAQHPLLAYRMLNRYANEFSAVGEHIAKGAEDKSAEEVYKIQEDFQFPTASDADDALTGLLRMQYMYDLKADDIANGRIPGAIPETAKLTTEQCYEIAKGAHSNQFYTLSLDWFQTAKTRLKNEPEDLKATLPFNSTMLDQEMLSAITEHNTYYEELYDEGHEYLFSKKIRSLDGQRPSTLRNQIVKQFAGMNISDGHPEYHQAIYAKNIALCNGENLQDEKTKVKLRCWLDSKRNPYWRLRPLKMELISLHPRIYHIHNFMPETWTSRLQSLAYGELEKAPKGPHATPRTAAYSWFQDKNIPEVPLSRRVELVTGLNVVGPKAAEALQVAAYAFGGHVELHYDSKGPEDAADPKGDRVSTFLIYVRLNDVEVGGLTAFPRLGFAVKPEKGSAVLWYTNKKHGGVDNDVLHGACPLIYGHKWIATKWTHSLENIFKRPCALSPKE